MHKTYILDTSILVEDPFILNKLSDSNIIIPVIVLTELDKLKKFPNEAGKNARISIRKIDEISNNGNLGEGIKLENNILVQVDTSNYDFEHAFFKQLGDPTYPDTLILACALVYNQSVENVVLLSNDLNLRIRAKARGVKAEGYENVSGKSANDIYTGIQYLDDVALGCELQQDGAADLIKHDLDMYPNECAVIMNEEGSDIAVARCVSPTNIKLCKKHYPWKLSPRNSEQECAMDLIMDPGLDLVTLIGKSGTGKSLVALACALELVLQKKMYNKLIIYRPLQAVGNEIGFLPGTLDEKLGPWFQAILDNFEVLFSNGKDGSNAWKRNLEMYMSKGQIEMEAMTYIRGRSIPNALVLMDEAQNVSKDEIKALLTRAGDGTKVILTGDIEQIDKQSLDVTSNGLTYVVDKFKDWDKSGHITLTQGERSRLATKSAEIL